MNAVRLHEYGPATNLLYETVPDPVLERPNDVRVGVHGAAINPIDWKIRAGQQRGAIRLSLPWIQGLDVSGEVLEVGSAVTRFKVGDLVYGCPDHRRPGSYAEQVVVEDKNLAIAPTSIPLATAAALPLAGLTAWQCLLPKLAEAPGQRVLIQAGSGGVGHLAIQLAKHHGAWVATTCSERNHAFVQGLGADEAIDYRTTNWWEAVSELDIVLDALGYEERDRALQAVKKGGRVASIVSGLPGNTEKYGPNLGLIATGLGVASFAIRGWLHGKQGYTVVKRTHADQLEALARLVDDGAVRPHIDRTFALKDLPDAHALGETHRICGKVILVP
jgi:NADPH:quinone reductase-like Zn-dependent oxidoreductase